MDYYDKIYYNKVFINIQNTNMRGEGRKGILKCVPTLAVVGEEISRMGK